LGTWSAGIFGDDVAVDVRERYLDLLADGGSGPEATRRVLADFRDGLLDSDDGPVIWTALAATQWEYGRLEHDVKERALAVLDGGELLQRWPESRRRSREAALAALRRKLLSRMPKPRLPRRKKAVEVPSHEERGPDGLVSATAFQIGSLGQVLINMDVGGLRGGGGVFAAECVERDIGLAWLDADTVQITYPAAAVPVTRKETSFFNGRTVKCVYRVR
jgi:hypothetical protein